MMDISSTVAPKSDQINADDLIGGPRTITVTKVAGNEGDPAQPINVFFEDDNGKPYRPCKSMRRVLISVWGKDALQYPGKSMTLYRDPAVKFGGMAVGGIRISHVSDIDKPITLALTATRASRKPYIVKPLDVAQKPVNDLKTGGADAQALADKMITAMDNAADRRQWEAITNDKNFLADMKWLESNDQGFARFVAAAVANAQSRLFGDETSGGYAA